MDIERYITLKEAVIHRGYATEVDWADGVKECQDADGFALEAIWVVLNSGMREQVARIIQGRILPLLFDGESSSGGFGHKLKCKAIDHIWTQRLRLFAEWRESTDRLAYLETLPHIGGITKYHLARNLGMDYCKPDRHLVRIAGEESPHAMCSRLAKETGDRIGVVDCVIWRAANLGLA
jgi:hypothetical protein